MVCLCHTLRASALLSVFSCVKITLTQRHNYQTEQIRCENPTGSKATVPVCPPCFPFFSVSVPVALSAGELVGVLGLSEVAGSEAGALLVVAEVFLSLSALLTSAVAEVASPSLLRRIRHSRNHSSAPLKSSSETISASRRSALPPCCWVLPPLPASQTATLYCCYVTSAACLCVE